MNHKIPSHGNLLPVTTDNFADTPPHAIADDGPAQRFLYAESKSALRQIVGAKKNGEVGIRSALTGAVDGIKVSTPHDARVTRKLQNLFFTA